jgi:hypothetical protein
MARVIVLAVDGAKLQKLQTNSNVPWGYFRTTTSVGLKHNKTHG